MPNMTIGLILTMLTSTGIVIKPDPYPFATMDMCQEARAVITEDILRRGGTVFSAVCVLQALKESKR